MEKACVYSFLVYPIFYSFKYISFLLLIDQGLILLFICNAFLHEENFHVDLLLDDDRFTSDRGSVSSLDRSMRVREYTFL